MRCAGMSGVIGLATLGDGECGTLPERSAVLFGCDIGAQHRAAACKQPCVVIYSGAILARKLSPVGEGVMRESLRKACFGTMLCSLTGVATAAPLGVVTVAAPGINCVFETDCTIVVTD